MLERQTDEFAKKYEQEIGLSIASHPDVLPWDQAAELTKITILGPLLSPGCRLVLSSDQEAVIRHYADMAISDTADRIKRLYHENPMFILDLALLTYERELVERNPENRLLERLKAVRVILRENQYLIKSEVSKSLADFEDKQPTIGEVINQVLAGKQVTEDRQGYYLHRLIHNYDSMVDGFRLALGIKQSLDNLKDQHTSWRKTGIQAFNQETLAPGALGHIDVFSHALAGEGWSALELSFTKDAVLKIATMPDLPPLL